MLDLFSTKQELSDGQFGGGDPTALAVLVEHYDLSNTETPFCVGKNINTGKEVKVTLRKNTKSANADLFTTIQALAGKDNGKINRWVREGGVILFTGAYEENGYWSASYCYTLSHGRDLDDKELLAVVKATGSSPSQSAGFVYLHTQAEFFHSIKDGKATAGVTVALLNDDHFKLPLDEKVKNLLSVKGKPIVAKSCKNFEDVKKTVSFLLKSQFGVIVRLKAEKDGDIAFRTYVCQKGATYDSLLGELDTAENRKQLDPMLENGSLVIEVIPTLTFFASKQLLKRLFGETTPIPTAAFNILNGAFNLPTNARAKRLNTISHIGLSLITQGYNEQKELVDIEPFLQLKVIDPEFGADRYVGFSTAAFYMKTDAIALDNPDWVIENKTTSSLSEVKFSAESVRNANGIGVNKDKAATATSPSEEGAAPDTSSTTAKANEVAQATVQEPDSFVIDDDEIPF